VDQFDDDLRGNFIQIVKTDLYRKDVGRKDAVRVEDGRPNFKKFKKKNIIRREPMPLALAGPTLEDAEMGEPFWPTQNAKVARHTQTTTQAMAVDDEDDDLPLLPRSRKRLLDTRITPGRDFDEAPRTSRKRGAASLRETEPVPSGPSARSRKVRGASVVSDASSTGAATRRAPARKAKKALHVIDGSEEEEVEADLPTATATGTGSGRSTGSGARTRWLGAGTGRSAMSSTLDGPTAPTASARPKGAKERKMLVDDDDDGEVIGLQKKRRLG